MTRIRLCYHSKCCYEKVYMAGVGRVGLGLTTVFPPVQVRPDGNKVGQIAAIQIVKTMIQIGASN